jgi:hypothetical protein
MKIKIRKRSKTIEDWTPRVCEPESNPSSRSPLDSLSAAIYRVTVSIRCWKCCQLALQNDLTTHVVIASLGLRDRWS